MAVTPSEKTINFTAVTEDRLSFLTKFVSGEEFVVETADGTYKLILVVIVRNFKKEGGANDSFFFTGRVVKAILNTGLSSIIPSTYSGYFESQNQSGWIKSIKRIEW